MSDAGQRIIESLKQAQAGDFARVTIEGQTWVRLDSDKAMQDTLRDARELLHDPDLPVTDRINNATLCIDLALGAATKE